MTRNAATKGYLVITAKMMIFTTMMMMMISSVCILDLSELSSIWEEVEECIFQPTSPCSCALLDRPLTVSKIDVRLMAGYTDLSLIIA